MRKERTWLIVAAAGVALLLTACGPKSRRAEIEQRKAALQQKQDSTLIASQEELAWVDSALEAAKVRFQQVLNELHNGSHSSAELRRLGDELTIARLHRDSLQIRYEVLCGKIQYIHRVQAQRRAGQNDADTVPDTRK